MCLTCSILHELGNALERDSQTKICSSGAFSTTQDVLKECMAVFEKIDSEIDKRDQEKGTNGLLRGAQKITLTFQGPDLDLEKSNLERLKYTMLLMLNVLVYAGQLRKYTKSGWGVRIYINRHQGRLEIHARQSAKSNPITSRRKERERHYISSIKSICTYRSHESKRTPSKIYQNSKYRPGAFLSKTASLFSNGSRRAFSSRPKAVQRGRCVPPEPRREPSPQNQEWCPKCALGGSSSFPTHPWAVCNSGSS